MIAPVALRRFVDGKHRADDPGGAECRPNSQDLHCEALCYGLGDCLKNEANRMKMRPWGLIAAAVVAVGALGGVWALMSASSGHTMGSDSALVGGTSPMDDHMSSGESTAALTEAQFITDMIPHHQQAVEMAQLALTRGTHPEVKTLARAILSAQESEISQMESWNRAWFGVEPGAAVTSGGHASMAGEIDALKTSSDFDRDFLTAMIPHHASAIDMANRLLVGAPRPELKNLASAIIVGQQKEIDQMRGWQNVWNS